ncbi:serine/threonine-protein kinase [Pyxidicoccus xibeiensis]|uniref:serine/threonine-protein kinase n=1 Tax=Pyxidicoccus xibeiensis TaxID=2906759 RepID=UPI0020A767C5|nr:protein kinase [Pyxidicoccus xibeiensis]MCP3142598.1 protein kinase [Pyxidicoccus xibeiensis]
MTLEAGTHIGKYVVRRKLAEGGMAEIYLCTARGPEGFEKEVVIKRVRVFLASDPEFVGMFIAEARLASRLNHANVVQIFDFDKHQDTYYLAMEYVRGCSLWELRKKSKELMEPVPPVLVAHIGAEVARGLHYAHRVKVNGQPLDLVHRDVTPHNVLLSYDGAVKLTDFGIAKAGKVLTQPGVLKGKFAYMSPEQARGEAVDARTDIFALGVVLWEMLTGGRLFDGDSEVAVLRAVQQSAIAPPARLNPDVPADLDAIVVRALDRDPAARFQTAGELERALAQCVLKHARTVDDTDLSAFMRRLFPSSHTQALPAVQERTHVESAPQPRGEDAAGSAPREPTAVMPGVAGGRGAGVAPSPDEDVNAATFVLARRAAEQGAVPLPPMATPMMPLPAVASSPVPRAPMPPVAAPIAAVRSSRPEGTPAVSPPEAGEGSGKRTSQPEGVSSVATGSGAKPPSRPEGVSSVVTGPGAGPSNRPERMSSLGSGSGAKLPSRPEGVASVSAQGVDASSGARTDAKTPSRPEGASSLGPDAQEDAGLSTEPAEAGRSGREVPATHEPDAAAHGKSVSSRRPWALGLAAVLGLAAIAGGIAVMGSQSKPAPAGPPPTTVTERAATPPSTASAPAEAPPGTAANDARTPAGRASADSEAEVEGLKREESLAAVPTPAAGESRPAPSEPQEGRAAAVSTGTLQVQAAPYATVFLNGKRQGEVAGRATYKLPPGTYKLVFEHPSGGKQFDVTITSGTTVTREFRASKGR